jgi:hypothetical protein
MVLYSSPYGFEDLEEIPRHYVHVATAIRHEALMCVIFCMFVGMRLLPRMSEGPCNIRVQMINVKEG